MSNVQSGRLSDSSEPRETWLRDEKSEKAIPTWPGAAAKILIVDDRPENLLAFRVILENLSEELVMAHSGHEAVEQVAAQDFAVILLDVHMPDMDGFEAARLMRNNERLAGTPIIFLTAYADDLHEAEAYSHGAVDFIETPVDPELLRSRVKVFIECSRMKEEFNRRRGS